MQKCTLFLLAFLLSGLATASDSPKEYDDAMVVDDLEGSWQLVSLQAPGLNLRGDESVYVFHDKKFTLMIGGTALPSGTYRTDHIQKHGFLDRTQSNYPFDGETTWKSIYRIDGDTLRIAGSVNPLQRPKEFDDTNIAIATLKRVRK